LIPSLGPTAFVLAWIVLVVPSATRHDQPCLGWHCSEWAGLKFVVVVVVVVVVLPFVVAVPAVIPTDLVEAHQAVIVGVDSVELEQWVELEFVELVVAVAVAAVVAVAVFVGLIVAVAAATVVAAVESVVDEVVPVVVVSAVVAAAVAVVAAAAVTAAAAVVVVPTVFAQRLARSSEIESGALDSCLFWPRRPPRQMLSR